MRSHIPSNPRLAVSRTVRSILSAAALTLLAGTALAAQQPSPAPAAVPAVPTPAPAGPPQLAQGISSSAAPAAAAAAALPDAPSPQITRIRPVNPRGAGGPPLAPLRAKYIPAGWRAQPLDVRAKIEVGATDLYSLEDFGAVILSAGYEQVLNSQPNYGTDRGAFGQRVGAAAIREASQGIFTDMVFASMLHQDPRYYQLGPGHSVVHRTLYAITRPLVTRTDKGNETVNGAMLLGYAASAALTPSFYPPINRNFHDTVSTYGGSLGGAALGFFISEFSNDILEGLHLKRKD